MVTTLQHGTRRARKAYRCGMCFARIRPGDLYAFQSNIYDDRAYTWRECLACDRDNVCTYVHDFTGGYHDEGVDFEAAVEWAEDAVGWPRYWMRPGRPITTTERVAARNWLARASVATEAGA